MPNDVYNSHYEKLPNGEVRCIDDEIPFEIPESWCWVRLGQVVQINPKNKAEDNAESAFIPMDMIDATYFSSFTYTSKKWKEIKNGFTHFADGDIAFAKITPCFQNRKSMILQNLPNGIGAGTTELKVLRPFANTINAFYLLFFLESAYFVEQAVFKGTANQQRIISGYMENKLFPLPPINEQIKIVERMKELLSLADKYGDLQNSLNKLNEVLPKQIKQSILQEAIQGRLVPQAPNDEPAEVLLQRIKKEKERLVAEGKLKRKDIVESTIYRGDDNKYYEKCGNTLVCIDDELTFDIPANWQWVRLNMVANIARGGSPRPIKEYLTNSTNGVNWIKIGDTEKDGKYINSTKEKIKQEGVNKSRFIHKGDFLLTNSMSFGRPYISNIEGCIHDGWLVISPWGNCYNTDFLYYLLSSQFAYLQFCGKVSGAVVQNLNSDKVANAVFPLPPLAEQQRIVDKIEDVLTSIMSR